MRTKFRLNWFFGPNLSKKGISSLKRKKWTSPLHIRISLGTTFQVKLTILILFFFDQICPKREVTVENRKTALVHASMVVTYYITSFVLPDSLNIITASYHIVRLTIWHYLFLEFWLVNTLFLAHWRHQRAQGEAESWVSNCHIDNLYIQKWLFFLYYH